MKRVISREAWWTASTTGFDLSTAAGKAARDFAKTLSVLSKGWDKFGGRIDGVIGFSGGDFAEKMISNGHAKPWDRPRRWELSAPALRRGAGR